LGERLVIVAAHAFIELDETACLKMSRSEHPTIRAMREHSEEKIVICRRYRKALRAASEQIKGLFRVATRVLSAGNTPLLSKLEERVVRDVHTSAMGDVVHDDWPVRGGGDPGEVLPQPVL
jgi:hypothetical protein